MDGIGYSKENCLKKHTEKLLYRYKRNPLEMSLMLSEGEERALREMLEIRKKRKAEKKREVLGKPEISRDNFETPQNNQNGLAFPYGRQPGLARLTLSYQIKNNLINLPKTREDKNNGAGDNSHAGIVSANAAIPQNVNNDPANGQRPIYPELLLKKNIEVKVSHVSSLCDFYVTKYADEPKLNEIQHFLYNSMTKSSIPYTAWDFSSGSVGAYEIDDLWYRVNVSNFSAKGESDIFLIDRGDSLRVRSRDVVAFPEYVAAKDPLAYRCSLNLSLLPTHTNEWATNFKLKLNNLHMACAPDYKLTVNAAAVENGVHSVKLLTGYFCDYSSALIKLSIAQELTMEGEDFVERNHWNPPLSDSNLGSLTTALSEDLVVSDPKDIFKDSADRLHIHRLKSTKFRVFRTAFLDFCFYIIPLENHLAELEEKIKLAFKPTDPTKRFMPQKFIPEVDEMVCIMSPERKFERVKVVSIGRDKQLFRCFHIDSGICAEYHPNDAIKLPEDIKRIQPVGFWVHMNKRQHLNPLRTNLEKFYNFVTCNTFVLAEIEQNYNAPEYPYVAMRVAEGGEQSSVTTDDVLSSVQHWRYELLLSIGYCTDDHFLEDENKNDLQYQLPSGEPGHSNDHSILERQMNRFYAVVKPSPLQLKVGQYVAVHIMDDQAGCRRKWHRSLVGPDNLLKCVDHLEQWQYTTDTSKMIVRRLLSEFLQVAPP